MALLPRKVRNYWFLCNHVAGDKLSVLFAHDDGTSTVRNLRSQHVGKVPQKIYSIEDELAPAIFLDLNRPALEPLEPIGIPTYYR
jgi:hypothetical protein